MISDHWAPDVPDLTIIDLPGITRKATGDQPSNIYDQIRGMIDHYCKGERSIMLAVYPVNADPQNCEAFKIASDLDPKGVRTIPLVTKPDTCSRELDIYGILSNQGPVNFEHSYCCLRNPNVDELNSDDHTRAKAETIEAEFFSHTGFDMAREAGAALGRVAFAGRLTEVLVSRIQDTLPGVIRDIETALAGRRAELHKAEESLMGITQSPVVARTKLMSQVQRLVLAIEGDFTRQARFGSANTLPRTLMESSTQFARSVRVICTPENCFKADDLDIAASDTGSVGHQEGEDGPVPDHFVATIAKIISNSRGLDVPGFISPDVLAVAVEVTLGHIKPHFERFVALAQGAISRRCKKRHLEVFGDTAPQAWSEGIIDGFLNETFGAAKTTTGSMLQCDAVLQLTFNHYMPQTAWKQLTQYIASKVALNGEDFCTKKTMGEKEVNVLNTMESCQTSIADALAIMSCEELHAHQAAFTIAAYIKTMGKKLADMIPQHFITMACMDHSKTTRVLQAAFTKRLESMSDTALEGVFKMTQGDKRRIQRLRDTVGKLEGAASTLTAVLEGDNSLLLGDMVKANLYSAPGKRAWSEVRGESVLPEGL
ncbi:dynamin superfamily protein [Kipferlia bialata]|uniref:Dynamin superfamily protein n=1 Tax=Kipferlia bialata TaxID=797122 RepID=A0A9K3CR99_9EUKA|nr:dynamin superfamily protein [Kipferlia bialata]|eukprot:g1781.t1